MGHMEEVAARWADPGMPERAQAKADELAKRLRAADINKMARALQTAQSPKAKKVWLMKMADTLATSLQGLAPCAAGCDHCCHMALVVTPEEAEAMGKASGRKVRKPAPEAFVRPDDAGIAKWEGTPCPMLKNGACSVYDVRPWPCRMHYSVDTDNLLCKIVPGANIRAPSPDVGQFNMLFFLAHGDPTSVKHADIREYFRD
jgi:Fe-S-cluster containining protein